MDTDALRTELQEMNGNDLKTRARTEYGIKVLPEHTKVDIVNLILGKVYSGGAEPAVHMPSGDKVRPGHARITLLDSQGEPDPFYIDVNGWRATIPRNVEVEVPHEILPTLRGLVYKGAIPDENGVLKSYVKHRAPFTVHQIDDSVPSGKLKFADRRERALEKKRKFFEKFDVWPTDAEMQEYLRTAGRDALYRGSSGNVPSAS